MFLVSLDGRFLAFIDCCPIDLRFFLFFVGVASAKASGVSMDTAGT